MSDTPLSTKPYKGVRDFYPEDKRRQEYLFSVLASSAEAFGYQEIAASVLERAALYDAKSGSELAEEQSYRFEDRGGREVMLRPEMTPTTARMLAAKHKSMSFPVRWFSIPNVFRYERPQRGRLREHWQFNAELFGITAPLPEVEVITLAHHIFEAFGAEEDDFVIKLNSRKLFQQFCNTQLSVDNKTQQKLVSLIDERAKIETSTFQKKLSETLNQKQQKTLESYLEVKTPEGLKSNFDEMSEVAKQLEKVLELLDNRDIHNAKFAPELMRGIDYYTGTVFEVFDTNPDNPRSICGGGRYDNLMDIFGEESIPAVGFGLGDVTLADFLETHDLWPDLGTALEVVVVLVDPSEHSTYGHEVARRLRETGLNVAVDISGSGVGSQIKQADKQGADEVVIIGDDEVANNTVTIKTLETGDEVTRDLTAAAL